MYSLVIPVTHRNSRHCPIKQNTVIPQAMQDKAQMDITSISMCVFPTWGSSPRVLLLCQLCAKLGASITGR